MARRRSPGATHPGRVNLPPPGGPCGALQALMNDGGQVTIGAIGELPAAAVAITPKGMLVGLALREGETWPELVLRLDATVVQAVVEDRIINELHR